MADDPRALVAERLARTYTAQMAALRDGAERGIGAVWDTLGSYNRADIDPFLTRALPVVEAAQTQAGALTDAYVAQQVQILSGDTVVPGGIAPGDVVGAAVRSGTAPETVYERSFIEVWSNLSDGVLWVDAVARGGHRARQAARTDVSLSGRRASQIAMGDKAHIVGYRRVLDGHSCRFCAVASTQRYHKADLMPLHPGCVLEGTVVAGPAALHGTRRRYQGEGVVLGTAAGHFLTVTPNHPVLTPAGWRPAGLLHEGDDVLSSRTLEGIGRSVPHEHEMPARIEDRFGALAVLGLRRVPLASEDFHGDGPDRHVDVVDPDGALWNRLKVALGQPFGELGLRWRLMLAVALQGLCPLHPFPDGRLAASTGGVGAEDLGLAFLGRHAAPGQRPGLGVSTDRHVGLDEMSSNHSSVDAELVSELQFGLACEIAGDHRLGQADPTGPRFDSTTSELGDERLLVDADRARSLLHRLAGQVDLDRVVLVDRVDLATAHVFNLHTTEGWYAANGVIVSNCGCGVAPIVGTHDPGQIINRDLLTELQQSSPDDFLKLVNGPKNDRGDWDRFGFIDHDGNPVAKGTRPPKVSEKAIRDANPDVKVVEHGELGPTLVSDRDHLDKPHMRKADSASHEKPTVKAGDGSGRGGAEPPLSDAAGVPYEGADAARRLSESFAGVYDTATSTERAAIARYQAEGRGYEAFNKALRGEQHPDDETLEAILSVRRLTQRAQLDEDVRVFKGVRDVGATFQVPNDQIGTLVGRTIKLRGFTSTTVFDDVAIGQFTRPAIGEGPVLLDLIAPRGAHAAWLPEVGDPDLATQGELLFGAGTRIVIREVTERGGLPVLVGEIVP